MPEFGNAFKNDASEFLENVQWKSALFTRERDTKNTTRYRGRKKIETIYSDMFDLVKTRERFN